MTNKKENERQYYLKHREKLLQRRKKHYIENKDKILEKVKQRNFNKREEIKEYMKKYMKGYRKNNKEKHKIWIENNREKIRESDRKYHKKNYEKIKERNKIDLKYNLNCRMSHAIYKSLRSNKSGHHWEIIVGYNLTDLIKHLQKTMPENYTWEDFLEGKLHIDHIIPIDAFNFARPEHTDFLNCWDLSNLRLLPAKDNLIKGAKLDRPFQPALQIYFKGGQNQ